MSAYKSANFESVRGKLDADITPIGFARKCLYNENVNEYPIAMNALLKISALDSTYGEANYLLGHLKLKTGEFEDAKRLFQQSELNSKQLSEDIQWFSA